LFLVPPVDLDKLLCMKTRLINQGGNNLLTVPYNHPPSPSLTQ